MAGFKAFEELAVYRLAEELADVTWEIVSEWRGLALDTVGKQMVRAADSVGANIAEGAGRGTYKDNCHFVTQARGSLCETRHWLRRAFRRHLLGQPEVNRIRPLIDELSPKLNAYRNSLRRRIPSATRRKQEPNNQ